MEREVAEKVESGKEEKEAKKRDEKWWWEYR